MKFGKKEEYNYESIHALIKEIEQKVEYKELKEFSLNYLNDKFTFKIDSLHLSLNYHNG